MTATNHTEHYESSQYTENDHPTYTGDYNGDMSAMTSRIAALESQVAALTAAATPSTPGPTTEELDA